MSQQIVRYNEQLTIEELDFLTRKDEKDTKQFYKVIRVLMIICFIIPFIVAWFRAIDGVPQPFSFTYYFAGVGFLLVFMFVCVYIAYRRTLFKVRL